MKQVDMVPEHGNGFQPGATEDFKVRFQSPICVYGGKDMKQVDLVPEHGNGFQPGTTEDFKVKYQLRLCNISPIEHF